MSQQPVGNRPHMVFAPLMFSFADTFGEWIGAIFGVALPVFVLVLIANTMVKLVHCQTMATADERVHNAHCLAVVPFRQSATATVMNQIPCATTTSR